MATKAGGGQGGTWWNRPAVIVIERGRPDVRRLKGGGTQQTEKKQIESDMFQEGEICGKGLHQRKTKGVQHKQAGGLINNAFTQPRVAET